MALTVLEPRETTVDACARALREAVLQGEFAVGARLPPERTLAETFRVNRVTVRGALGRLVAEGLLAVRQGSGYLVQDFLREGGPDLVLSLARGADAKALADIVRDLLEVRRGVARAVLERLVKKKPSRAAVARVRRAVDALEEAAQRGAPARELAQADLEVLAAVVAATGSAVIQLWLNPIATVLLGLPRLVGAMFKAPLENVLAWRLLADWMDAPKADALDVMMAVLSAHDEATVASLKKETK